MQKAALENICQAVIKGAGDVREVLKVVEAIIALLWTELRSYERLNVTL